MKQDGSQGCLNPSYIPLSYGLCPGEVAKRDGMKQGGSQGCLKPSISPPSYGLCLGEVDALRRGPKEIKFQRRTILKTINTLYSILYNPHFQKMIMNEKLLNSNFKLCCK